MTALVVGSRRYFYPRPPRGGRLVPGVVLRTLPDISIHALREEGDRLIVLVFRAVTLFLSTPSARRATAVKCINHFVICISIHALREEGDWWTSSSATPPTNFYPRPPRGGRQPVAAAFGAEPANFYPRPPRGGRRSALGVHGGHRVNFYPRPPRGGRRSACLTPSPIWTYFYPRPPRGGRR